MSAFMFVEITVREPETYAEYMAQAPAVIAQYGGTYLVRSSKVTPVAGGWTPERMVVIRFDDIAALRACFGSEEYRALAALRERATLTRSVVVED